MSATRPFGPDYGNGTGPLAGGASSQNTPIRKGSKNLRVLVTGTGVGYFKTYLSTNTTDTNFNVASTKDVPVTGGLVTTITKPEGHDGFAYIGTGLTFYPITGEGW